MSRSWIERSNDPYFRLSALYTQEITKFLETWNQESSQVILDCNSKNRSNLESLHATGKTPSTVVQGRKRKEHPDGVPSSGMEMLTHAKKDGSIADSIAVEKIAILDCNSKNRSHLESLHATGKTPSTLVQGGKRKEHPDGVPSSSMEMLTHAKKDGSPVDSIAVEKIEEDRFNNQPEERCENHSLTNQIFTEVVGHDGMAARYATTFSRRNAELQDKLSLLMEWYKEAKPEFERSKLESLHVTGKTPSTVVQGGKRKEHPDGVPSSGMEMLTHARKDGSPADSIVVEKIAILDCNSKNRSNLESLHATGKTPSTVVRGGQHKENPDGVPSSGIEMLTHAKKDGSPADPIAVEKIAILDCNSKNRSNLESLHATGKTPSTVVRGGKHKEHPDGVPSSGMEMMTHAKKDGSPADSIAVEKIEEERFNNQPEERCENHSLNNQVFTEVVRHEPITKKEVVHHDRTAAMHAARFARQNAELQDKLALLMEWYKEAKPEFERSKLESLHASGKTASTVVQGGKRKEHPDGVPSSGMEMLTHARTDGSPADSIAVEKIAILDCNSKNRSNLESLHATGKTPSTVVRGGKRTEHPDGVPSSGMEMLTNAKKDGFPADSIAVEKIAILDCNSKNRSNLESLHAAGKTPSTVVRGGKHKEHPDGVPSSGMELLTHAKKDGSPADSIAVEKIAILDCNSKNRSNLESLHATGKTPSTVVRGGKHKEHPDGVPSSGMEMLTHAKKDGSTADSIAVEKIEEGRLNNQPEERCENHSLNNQVFTEVVRHEPIRKKEEVVHHDGKAAMHAARFARKNAEFQDQVSRIAARFARQNAELQDKLSLLMEWYEDAKPEFERKRDSEKEGNMTGLKKGTI